LHVILLWIGMSLPVMIPFVSIWMSTTKKPLIAIMPDDQAGFKRRQPRARRRAAG
jgi:hypothetical protein